MAKKLFLIRHAVVEEQYRGKLLGRTDAPLAPGYQEQMVKVARILREEGCDVVVSSPISRAWQCAQVLNRMAPLEENRDLAEIQINAALLNWLRENPC